MNRPDNNEAIDVHLVTSQSIWDCIKTAFELIAKEHIRNVLESHSYETLAKETAEEM